MGEILLHRGETNGSSEEAWTQIRCKEGRSPQEQSGPQRIGAQGGSHQSAQQSSAQGSAQGSAQAPPLVTMRF